MSAKIAHKGHVGDGGIQAHSAGPIYPLTIVTVENYDHDTGYIELVGPNPWDFPLQKVHYIPSIKGDFQKAFEIAEKQGLRYKYHFNMNKILEMVE
jgi:hypothetical protein